MGVVVCIAIAVGTAGTKLRSALGIFDLRADTNATYTYSQRAHTHPDWSLAGGEVLETARLWMPADATYRVVYGPACRCIGPLVFPMPNMPESGAYGAAEASSLVEVDGIMRSESLIAAFERPLDSLETSSLRKGLRVRASGLIPRRRLARP